MLVLEVRSTEGADATGALAGGTAEARRLARRPARGHRSRHLGLSPPADDWGCRREARPGRAAAGDRARLFENLARLNCLLQLVHLHILGLDDPATYARLLRENHVRYDGTPPPRRLIDGAGFEGLPAAA